MKVIAATQNFGMGPTSALSSILELLPRTWQIDAFVPPHLAPVLGRHENIRVEFDPDNKRALAAARSYDAAIISCDYELAAALREQVSKVIVFDTLFWFWPSIPKIVSSDILVIAQNFVGVEERAKRFKSVRVVGPIIGSTGPNRHPRTPAVTVNLGGFTSPYNLSREAQVYAKLLSPLIMELASKGTLARIMGGEGLLREVAELVPNIRAIACTEAHESALARMCDSTRCFTTPGLGSIYETTLSKTPVFFLPPTNFTQALQLRMLSHATSHPWSISSSALSTTDEAKFIEALYSHYEEDLTLLSTDLVRLARAFLLESDQVLAQQAERAYSFSSGFGDQGMIEASGHLRGFLDAAI